jgi:phosphoenolpyruvate-protein kinase (PTS system EI component)
MMNNDIEEKYSVDSTNEKGNNEDSKVQQRDSARTKDSSVVDIAKSVNTSKDIIDIADNPELLFGINQFKSKVMMQIW